MKLNGVKVVNYRNLDGVKIALDPNINFLVGEHNLGKSNLLDMLNTLFNGRRFLEEDFFNPHNPIEIEFSIILSEAEKGIFEDYFDPMQSNVINIIAKQENADDDIRYFHMESEEEIPYLKYRCINYLKYDSLRTPKEELSFHRGRGVGKFLSYLVEKFINQETSLNTEDYIKKESLKPVIDYINKFLTNIRLLKDFKISANIEDELNDLLYRILTIKDSKGFQIQKIGLGIQFSILIVLSIFEKLMRFIEYGKKEECMFMSDNQKQISLILGLDEPEIHLHPYMQRSVIKFVNNIIQNKEDEFSFLIKELFDIDKIDGQAIIVTHSPTILLNQYKYVVRFYVEHPNIKVIYGKDITLDRASEKHLLKNFIYIKEAFFSRCVILVEGDTEYAVLPLWAEKIIGDLDELGISVIQAGGSNSVPPVAKLLSKLKIPNVSIIDRDNYLLNKNYYDQIGNLKITKHKDFEQELIEHLTENGNFKILFQIFKECEFSLDVPIQKNKLKSIAEEYNINITWKEKDFKFSEIESNGEDINLIKAMFLSWLNKKSIILGRTLGEKVDLDLIPPIYKEVIELAKTNAEKYSTYF